MARLDPIIEQLFLREASELVFEAGASAYLRTSSGVVPVFKQPLTAQQIIGAFAEFVPEDVKTVFPPEGLTTFPYVSPHGRIAVRFEKRGGLVRVNVFPDPSGTVQASGLLTSAPSAEAQVDPSAARQSWAWGPTRAPVENAKPRNIVEKRVFVRGSPRESMDELLATMLEQRASDLHLNSRVAPVLRVDGGVQILNDYGELTPDRLKEMLFSIAPERNREEWTRTKDSDFAHETERARFRVNLFEDRNGIGAVLRQIPNRILTAEELGLPQPVLELCHMTKGLIVVTGPTGSGKSTTLAGMIDYVNTQREDHIITIEDPIEFVHSNRKCLVNQREVGVNTGSFKAALRAALREDPDIVLVGEMRDLETVAIAIETAETGHLVFGTLHTNTAASTVERMIDQFPADRQQQIRLMLSESLRGVVAQTLCRKIGGGRVAALEILICTPAVSNLIREGKTFQIASVMQTGRALGMVTLNDSLFDLVKRRVVEPAEAYAKAVAKAELKAMLERAGFVVEAKRGG